MRSTVASGGASSWPEPSSPSPGTTGFITAPMSIDRCMGRPPAGRAAQASCRTPFPRIGNTAVPTLYLTARPRLSHSRQDALPVPALRQAVKLAVLHPGQERADFGAGVDEGGAGRVTRVAHDNLAVRERRYLDAVPARVA